MAHGSYVKVMPIQFKFGHGTVLLTYVMLVITYKYQANWCVITNTTDSRNVVACAHLNWTDNT